MRSAAALLAAASCWLPSVAAAQDDPPIRLGATYVTDVLSVADGGIKRGIVWLGRGDITASVEGHVFGIDGAELFIDIIGVQPADFSGHFVGDAQTVSNVQADTAIHPYEAWISLPLAAGLTGKAGLIDLNSEFDVQDVGKLFLNSSFGIGPDFSQSGRNGPSIFPIPSTALLLKYQKDRWTGRLGVFDAVAGSLADPRRTAIRFPGQRGALIVAEVERQLDSTGEIQLGIWHYTTRFASLDPTSARREKSQGAYALIEGQMAALGTSTVSAWGRIGVASADANPIGFYLGGGMTWHTGEGELGLAVAHAALGDPAKRAAIAAGAPADNAETTIELTYARPIIPAITVQPDLQYVIDPGWVRGRRNALVAGVRFSFSFPAK
jgi:porin